MSHLDDTPSSPGSLTIHKAINILRSFTPDMPKMTLQQITEKTKMPRSTVHRLLVALQNERLIELDHGSGKYQLGLELLVFAGTLLVNFDIRKIALPFMRQLAEHWRETVCLDVIRGKDIIIMEQIAGQHFIRTGGTFAASQPAHCTSTGKVLLAYKGRDYVIANLPEDLPAFTENTITSRDRLLDELAQIRKQGYAVSEGEYGEMVTACAAPIFNERGEILAAMSISGLAIRINGENFEPILIELLQVTKNISTQLGYVG